MNSNHEIETDNAEKLISNTHTQITVESPIRHEIQYLHFHLNFSISRPLEPFRLALGCVKILVRRYYI